MQTIEPKNERRQRNSAPQEPALQQRLPRLLPDQLQRWLDERECQLLVVDPLPPQNARKAQEGEDDEQYKHTPHCKRDHPYLPGDCFSSPKPLVEPHGGELL